ncbi:mediator of RNA polymerase II transcription subunit 26-like [Branchiostoma floridae x Branchiostoma belcheri]
MHPIIFWSEGWWEGRGTSGALCRPLIGTDEKTVPQKSPLPGPMNSNPHQIKNRLLRAIDQDANIVDMEGVLEVVSALEKTTMTKDALEKTRLGKYVNDVRRKTNNADLAKRLKQLVRIWQKLIIAGDIQAPDTPSNQGISPKIAMTRPGISPKLPAKPTEARPGSSSGSSAVLEKTNSANRKRRKLSTDADEGPKPKRPATPSQASSVAINGLPRDRDSPVPSPLPTSRRNHSPAASLNRKPQSPAFAERRPGSPAIASTKARSNSPALGVRKLAPGSPAVAGSLRKTSSPVGSLRKTTSSPVGSLRKTSSPVGSVRKTSSPVQFVPSGQLQLLHDSNTFDTPPPTPDLTSTKSLPANVTSASVGSPRPPPSLAAPTELANRDRVDTKKEEELSPPSSTLVQSSSISPVKVRLPSTSETFGASELSGSQTSGEKTEGKKKSKSSKKKDKSKNKEPVEESPEESSEVKPAKRVKLKQRSLTFDPVTRQIVPNVPQSPAVTVSVSYDRDFVPNLSAAGRPGFPGLSHDLHQPMAAGKSHSISKPITDEAAKERELKRQRALELIKATEGEPRPGVDRPVSDEDLQRLSKEKWPGVSGCFDDNGDWRDWTECCEKDSFEDGVLQVLPYVILD